MKDRESTYPGRVKLTPVEGADDIFDLTRADEPVVEGTVLNKRTLLPDYLAEALGLNPQTATPADAFKVLAQKTPGLIEGISVNEIGGSFDVVVSLDDGKKCNIHAELDEQNILTELSVNGRDINISWEVF